MIRLPRPLLVITVAAGAAVAVAAAELPASSVPPLAPRLTATQLAQGLLFNQGKAARYLTLLGRPQIRMTRSLRILQRSVDRKLASHPEQAAAFAKEVQSGNRVEVTAGLRILDGFTLRALRAEVGRKATGRIVSQAAALLHSQMMMAANGDGSGSAQSNDEANNYAYLQVLAFLALAVVVVVAVVVALAVLAFSLAARQAPDRLAAERMINLVAIGLQAAR